MRRLALRQAEFNYISDARSIRPEYRRGKMPVSIGSLCGHSDGPMCYIR